MNLNQRVLIGLLTATLLACGSPSSHRQSQRDQNEANTETELSDLASAEGVYTGVMHMTESHQDFKFTLTLTRTFDNYTPVGSNDPTQKQNIPKLSGALNFDAITKKNFADAQFSELLDPMGGFYSIVVNQGDYDPNSNRLILPYGISGYTGNFGTLQGKLINNVFTGIWNTSTLGNVGQFKANLTTSSSEL